MIKTFKERWNETDQRCPYCNHITKKAVGLNKQNLKGLFAKPTLQDITIFILLIGCLALVWFYYQDITQYKLIIENPEELCTIYYNQMFLKNSQDIAINNITFVINTSFNTNG